jgi:hypothetical protein
MAVLPKAIYMFNATPIKILILIKIPMVLITENKKLTIKFIWKHIRPQIAKAILSKKSISGDITIPSFKLNYRTKAIRTAWY